MDNANIEQTYTLKVMVAARLCAEVTVLLLLIALPIVLMTRGDFMQIPLVMRTLTVLMGVVALVVLPAYGFVTYKVTVGNDNLITASVFRKQMAAWSDIKTVTLESTWGARRFVVKTDGEELTFPIWLNNIKQLTEQIRGRLPNRGKSGGTGTPGAPKVYHESLPATVLQIGKLFGGIFFIGLFWTFFYSMMHEGAVAHAHHMRHGVDPGDKFFILMCCIILTIIMILRCVLLALLPKKITVDGATISLSTWFFQRSFAWSDIKSMTMPFFFIPECFVVRTTKGFFLLGDQLDAFDELEEEISKHTSAAA